MTAILVVLVVSAGGAASPSPPTPWDGTNPFHCTLQDAGTGTSVPDPSADPFCVRFDKTQQNVTQLGLVDFLLKEPARVQAAAPKCFYFQEDHWRGSIIQSDGSTVIYEFIGHYFFDKATGDGGAWVTGFTVAGHTFDPTTLPGFPPQYGRYFGPGTGGVITHDQVPADPRCAALARSHPDIYANAAASPRCLPGAGPIDRHGIGPVLLGRREDQLRAIVGPPQSVRRGFLSYCVAGGGSVLGGEPGDRSGSFGSGGRAPTVIVLTTARGYRLRGIRRRAVAVGATTRALRRVFPRERRVARIGGVGVMSLRRGLVAEVRRGRVVVLGAYAPAAIRTRGALAQYLRRAR